MSEVAHVRTLLCPYCGHTQEGGRQCARCRGLFEPLSRQATQNSMGPWQVRDETSPFTPGCSYETLRGLVGRGRVRADTVLRGPTTNQFWRRADETPGVSHFFGLCHSCRAPAHADDRVCSHCGESFQAPTDRQSLGLSPIRPLGAPRQESPLSPVTMPATRAPSPHSASSTPALRIPTSSIVPEFEPMVNRSRSARRGSTAFGIAAAVILVGVLGALAFVLLRGTAWPWGGSGSARANADLPPQSVAETPVVAGSDGTDGASKVEPAASGQVQAIAWQESLRAARDRSASGVEADLRAALEAARSIREGFPDGGAPAEVAAEIDRLERRLDEVTLRRFVW